MASALLCLALPCVASALLCMASALMCYALLCLVWPVLCFVWPEVVNFMFVFAAAEGNQLDRLVP